MDSSVVWISTWDPGAGVDTHKRSVLECVGDRNSVYTGDEQLKML